MISGKTIVKVKINWFINKSAFVDHTTLPKKASLIPYEAIKEILRLLGSRFNRDSRGLWAYPLLTTESFVISQSS